MRGAPIFHFHEEGPDNRHHDPGSCQCKGQVHCTQAVKGLLEFRKGHEGRAKDHGPDDRAHVGFEKVSSHPGDIPYVIPDVIGNRCRVQGVVFGNPRLDFPHQVGPDVSCFGINTPAHTGKKGDGRSTERKPGKHVQHHGNPVYGTGAAFPVQAAVKHKQTAEAQYPEAHNAHSHHGTPCKSHFKGFAKGGAGRVCGPDIGFSGDLHTDKSCEGRTNGPHDKGNGDHSVGAGLVLSLKEQQHGHSGHKNGQDPVFGLEE